MFDVVVVGAGHAGCEAAAVAARLGRRVALVALDLDAVGRLSCNPAIGGQGKGHLVREIDALGGVMARVADATTLQFRHLNTRKGLAVRASRAQVDVDAYPEVMAATLARLPTLTLVAGEVVRLDHHAGRVRGVILADGTQLATPRVILTTGTFLRATLHEGARTTPGGRVGEGAAVALADQIRDLGLRTARFKTGTVPRLRASTIDWAATEAQEDDIAHGHFSFAGPVPRLGTIRCHHVHTNAAVHDAIRAKLHLSPLFSGGIVGTGPRYCPSIEDKVTRFADKERHLLFLEPEGLRTDRVYVNGFSTSLPAETQVEMVRAIPALSRAEVMRPGYAVEYDVIDPTQLDLGLGLGGVEGLHFAGQVNGTSGYEEAAAQGLIAGLSAALGEPLVVRRDEAYLGVLIDDLVHRGPGGEPYRMFTSRAEHRLALREDNADRRLLPRGRALGLVDDATWARFETREGLRQASIRGAHEHLVTPGTVDADRAAAAGLPVRLPQRGTDLLRRPDATWEALRAAAPQLPALDADLAETVESDIRYAPYIEAAEARIAALRARPEVAIPPSLDFDAIGGLTPEVRQRLARRRPTTLDELGRLPGITAGAVDAIAAAVGRSTWNTAT